MKNKSHRIEDEPPSSKVVVKLVGFGSARQEKFRTVFHGKNIPIEFHEKTFKKPSQYVIIDTNGREKLFREFLEWFIKALKKINFGRVVISDAYESKFLVFS